MGTRASSLLVHENFVFFYLNDHLKRREESVEKKNSRVKQRNNSHDLDIEK
jgi:hypothetical protein